MPAAAATAARPTGVTASLPGRISLASEAFSAAIEFLLPDLRRDCVDGAPPEELDRLLAGYSRGDDTADALVAAMRVDKALRQQFEQALTGGVETLAAAAPVIRDFFATVDTVPDWIEEEKVALGVRTQRRIDGLTSAGAGFAMGFQLAAILPNSSKAMSTNARAVENAGRRLAETGRIALDLNDPNGRGRFGAGTISSTRLRILHASVRRYLNNRPDWDHGFYGTPISASDNLGASLVGCAIVQAARRAGYRFSDEELEGTAHLVGLFAYRQGVPVDLIPRTHEEQLRAFYIFLRTARGTADRDAIATLMPPLTRIEVEGLPPVARTAIRHLYNAYGRRIFGPELCDATGIPDSPLRHALPLVGLAIRPYEAVRVRSKRVDRLTHRAADLMWQRVMPLLYSDEATYDADHVAKVVKA
ncbi:hypothetical protein GCM10009547_11210 [Sporichthya brevicatena]|uniref:ER-bound oxygenase mpaB/mpaB'/Rubber oxygenase catalytic domain-containing protein n=1 Tax=Sporichthya brevicatena TaxID=171442 RepID=A0ABN1GGC7_9ACTN